MNTLAERLQHAMSARHVSAADLARHVGVSEAAVSLWLSAENSKKPTEAWLTQIDAGSRLGQNGKVGGGQVVLPPDKRRGVK